MASAAAGLNGLESYRYTTSLAVELPSAGEELATTTGSVEAEGEVVPPARVHHRATTTLGTISAEEELVRLPEGEFIKRPQGYTEGLGELNTFIVSAPVLWAELAAIVHLLPEEPVGTPEELDGAEVVRYTMDGVRLLMVKDYVLRLFGAVASAEVLPDFYQLAVWVSEERGIVQRVEISGQGPDPIEGEVTFHLESWISDIGEDFAIGLE